MHKLVVGWPVTYQLPAPWFLNMVAMDKTHVVGTVAIQGTYLNQSMYRLVDQAFADYGDEFDRLVIMEHDVLPPIDGFTRMASYDWQADIVGSLIFRHEAPHEPYVFKKVADDTELNRYAYATPEEIRKVVEAPALYETAAVSFGFTSIARHVFEKWDPDIPLFDFAPPFGSHDMWFSYQAQKQGFKIFIDSGILCGHLSTFAVGYEDNQRYAKEKRT